MTIWKRIKPYKNYFVSNDGRVKNITTGKELKQWLAGRGYRRVRLYMNSVKQDYIVHRLVGIYLIPNPNNYPQIDHINRIKTDNRKINLKWCSQSKNMMNRKVQKNNKLGKKYIQKRKNGYIFRFTKNNFYQGKFKTLDDAIKYRNAYIQKYAPDCFYE